MIYRLKFFKEFDIQWSQIKANHCSTSGNDLILFDIIEWQITWARDLFYRSRDKIASVKQILSSISILLFLLPEASEILRQDGHIVFLKTEITNNGCNLQDSLTGQLMGAAFSATGENARFVSLV